MKENQCEKKIINSVSGDEFKVKEDDCFSVLEYEKKHPENVFSGTFDEVKQWIKKVD
jgi:hypothetical protein